MKKKNSDLGAALSKALSTTKRSERTRSSLRPLHQVGEDGIDHININFYIGKTTLGRVLDTMVCLEFEHPKFGKFKTIDGFRYWLMYGACDDRYRHTETKFLKRINNKSEKKYVKSFRAIMISAIWCKISQNKELEEALINSDLPLDYYKLVRGKNRNKEIKERYNNAGWMVPAIETMRSLLKNNMTVDVTGTDFSPYWDKNTNLKTDWYEDISYTSPDELTDAEQDTILEQSILDETENKEDTTTLADEYERQFKGIDPESKDVLITDGEVVTLKSSDEGIEVSDPDDKTHSKDGQGANIIRFAISNSDEEDKSEPKE